MRHSSEILAVLLTLGPTLALRAADWITAPSYYSHDPQTGDRVRQYSPIGPFYSYQSPNYQRSGYRHTRSVIQAGVSADNLHIVDQWGPPVQPYGEWRFPYRPYSVPYAAWGPPFAGLNMGLPFAGFPWGPMPYDGSSYGGSGPYSPGRNRGNEYYNGFPPQRPWEPWYDGSYQTYGSPRLPDREFFQPPISGPGRRPRPEAE